MLAACNEPAEVAFRAGAREPRSRPRRRSASEGVDVAPAAGEWPLAAPEMLVLEGRIGEGALARIAAGELTPQSRGSAAVVEVLDPQPGEHVLDLCAGPGIKTGQIAERMGGRGETMSVELDPARAADVAAQAGRLGLRTVTVVEADAAAGAIAAGFDRVLVDAPCSDLGALASRPDARWRKSQQGIERLAEVQSGILARAAESLRPGGTLVYATCTISRRENEDRVAALREASARAEAAAARDRGPRRARPGARLPPRPPLPADPSRPR